jgi:hypothetical protein
MVSTAQTNNSQVHGNNSGCASSEWVRQFLSPIYNGECKREAWSLNAVPIREYGLTVHVPRAITQADLHVDMTSQTLPLYMSQLFTVSFHADENITLIPCHVISNAFVCPAVDKACKTRATNLVHSGP